MRKRRMMRPAKDCSPKKMILAWIMKECVQEYAGMDVREIVKYIEGAPQTAEIPVAPDEAAIQRVSGRSTEDISLNEGTVTCF